MEVAGFEWDEDNESHIQKGLSPNDVDDVLESSFAIVRNKNDRAGRYKVLGVNRGGRAITVIIASTNNPRIWRPVNAWDSDREERSHARKAGIYQ